MDEGESPMTISKPRLYSRLVATSLWIALTQLTGCATASYDQQADQQITSITKDVTLQFVTWENQAKEKKPVAYDATFYNKAEADISTLEMRMEASQDPATSKLIDIFKSLTDQLEAVRALHKRQNNLSEVFAHAELQLLSVQLATLTTFELSLKGGQSSGSSKDKTASTATSQAKTKASGANGVVSKELGGGG
jgi:hypothetical protein